MTAPVPTSQPAPTPGEQRELVLIRHGETAWSQARKHTGRTDIPLLDEGRTQVRERVAPLVSDRAFSLVLCSPLARARETAELAGLPPATIDDDLLEWDYGDDEGRTTAEIRAQRPGWLIWRDGCPGGESPDDIGVRCDRVIARALGSCDDGPVALVAHAHLLRTLAARWLGQPPGFGGSLWLATASVSVLGFEREGRVIRRWNS